MIGRSALAEFLHNLSPSKAHWYTIIPPCVEEHNSCFICSVFPSLSDLLSLDDSIWKALLVHLGLASYWRGTICSPLIASWERFIGKYQLKIQTTLFKLGGKQHLFLQIGSWNEKRHPSMKPADIWAMALRSGSYPVPKLRISSLSMWFASAVAELD